MDLTKLEKTLDNQIGTLEEAKKALEIAKNNLILRKSPIYLARFVEELSKINLQETTPRIKVDVRYGRHSTEPEALFALLRFKDNKTDSEIDLFSFVTNEERTLLLNCSGHLSQLSSQLDRKWIPTKEGVYSSTEYYIDLTDNKEKNIEIILDRLIEPSLALEIKKIFLESQLTDKDTIIKRNKI